jgi:hypothetical protein
VHRAAIEADALLRHQRTTAHDGLGIVTHVPW